MRPMSAKYLIADLTKLDAVPCPCGHARRAFAVPDNVAATVHLVDISADARPHYHKRLTEIYLVLEGEGHLELDDKVVPVAPMTVVMIRPGCRHRAVGKLRIVNLVTPPFDPADEWFD